MLRLLFYAPSFLLLHLLLIASLFHFSVLLSYYYYYSYNYYFRFLLSGYSDNLLRYCNFWVRNNETWNGGTDNAGARILNWFMWNIELTQTEIVIVSPKPVQLFVTTKSRCKTLESQRPMFDPFTVGKSSRGERK